MLKLTYPFNRDHLGFTLIEVIIAISLLSLLMLGVYSIFDSSIRTKDEVVADDRDLLAIETALSVLESDISKIYTPLFFTNAIKTSSNNSFSDDLEDLAKGKKVTSSFDNSAKYSGTTKLGFPIPKMESLDKSSFQFMILGNKRRIANTKQSTYAWVKYSLRSSTSAENRPEANNELIRQYYATNIYSPYHLFDEVTPVIVMKNIKSLEFSYYDAKKEKYVPSISDLSSHGELRLVKISLEWIDLAGGTNKTSRIFRPIFPSFDETQDGEATSDTENLNETESNIPEAVPPTTATQAQGEPEDPDE